METKRKSPLRRGLRRVEMGAQNALELLRFGRFAPREGAPFEVVYANPIYRLRRYPLPAGTKPKSEAPLLLVPPLMVSAEIYDIAPDISSVAALSRAGIDVFLIDFGAPEQEEGGMERTLDDHVRAVADAIARARELTGHSVHVAGYSQGGMFVYQAAAYRRCEGVASIVTFGSPVDIHRNLPGVSAGAMEQLVRAASTMIERPLKSIEGLPGVLTSTGFKLLSFRKEVMQLVDFVGKLHDRQALVKRESRRRFLAGEGFVAWPGPALRTFIEEFIVHNRLISGGFVIDGRTVTLADLNVPVLAFIGDRDEIARPEAIAGIRDAAPAAEVYEVHLPAGHFGLVVGSTALTQTWPTVVQWVEWREKRGPRPGLVPAPVPPVVVEPEDADLGADLDFDLFYDAAIDTVFGLWRRLGEATEDAGDLFDSLRYQLPKLTFLERLDGDTRTSAALELERRARAIPTRAFFLWEGRALTYGDSNRRVDNVVRGFHQTGIRKGARIGVLMTGRPSFLVTVAALNRMGAVAVVLPPTLDDEALARAVELGEIEALVTDPEHIERATRVYDGRIQVLGGGGGARTLPAGVVDMEAIDPARVTLPSDFEPNAGRARDLALVLFRSNPDGEPRAVSITNGRWAFSAYGAAAACTLTPNDTVSSCLPLQHPTGLLVMVGSALVSGARLALGAQFRVDDFWDDVHRYGVTVAYYAGEMGRVLADAPKHPLEQRSSLRMLAGSGLRPDAWERLRARFPKIGVLEFYAATEVNLVLANASGKKIGSLGRPLPGSADIEVASYDFATQEFRRDPWGRCVRAAADEPGILLARLDAKGADTAGIGDMTRLGERVKRDVFAAGDAWYVSDDVARRDADGDYFYVDRKDDVIRTARGAVPSRDVEDVLLSFPGIALAAVFPRRNDDGTYVPEAVVVPRPGTTLDGPALAKLVTSKLAPHERPSRVRIATQIPMTEAMRPLKSALATAPVSAADLLPGYSPG